MKRGNNETELAVYLFDHALLLAKKKHKNGHFKFYRKVNNLGSVGSRGRPAKSVLINSQ